MGVTLSTFRNRVLAYSQVDGQPYLSTDGDVNVLIGERLRSFTSKTRCLYGVVKFTPVAAQRCYRFDNPAAGSAFGTTFQIDANNDGTYDTNVGLVKVYTVFWGNCYLNPMYRPGTARALAESFTWPDEADGTPRYWHQSSNELYLSPAPTSAVVATAVTAPNVCVLNACYQHPAILAATSDATNLSISDEHTEVAAAWVAVGLMRPYATGASLDKRRLMEAECNAAMEAIRNESDQRYERGYRNRTVGWTTRITS